MRTKIGNCSGHVELFGSAWYGGGDPADSKVTAYGKIDDRTVGVTIDDFTILAVTSS